MKLRSLLESINIPYEKDTIPEIDIEGLHFHSKKMSKNHVFVAISGYELDGHNFINDAINAGAVAVIGEKPITNLQVPYFQVSNARKILPQLAKTFYGNPNENHTIIGITGTNGKTTSSYMLRHILEHAGIPCSLIGTISHIINGEQYPSGNTTPDSLTLHQLISKSKDSVIIIEVSSHGIDQGRVEGIEFDYALFTNLSHDHLNYHGSLFSYFDTKAKLFDQIKKQGTAYICTSSEWGTRLVDRLIDRNRNVCSVGYQEADHYNLENVSVEFATEFTLNDGKNKHKVTLPMSGVHNAWNASLTFVAAQGLGIEPKNVIEGLSSFPGVPGRFEKYSSDSGITCVVDYAHTPDALTHCLQTVKKISRGRVFHVFGFRGKGDVSKRKEMILLSAQLSDQFVLTLDDLNGVSEGEMLNEYHKMQLKYGGDKGKVFKDRTIAIQFAIEQAQPDDWIVITGKGPESYKHSFFWPTKTDKDTFIYLTEVEDAIEVPISITEIEQQYPPIH
ncbi:UDP-N-acetylmuramoyl-L-alanyl-D-glutamate--2,6-diaminopimelate ligase [Bacillus alkalicellulosilyticus]|uniref:UDP-N-acetylmuramoyl-L-alanyl-D-glutamate--2, 6-diaminopimelate ligase n=1 Tax=Alkalihalobacterium alkalicellulosilyticum TaxID=1912214 RepID=UPI000997FAD9|nr:UDP-N-acetylmuramoyl-L-alanyl-D-glutamate--2,6-diaminopimelate ligase [Bacillus alkalicellulosilyticus]